jgi:hypothetical protein
LTATSRSCVGQSFTSDNTTSEKRGRLTPGSAQVRVERVQESMGLGLKAQKSVVSDQLGRPGSGDACVAQENVAHAYRSQLRKGRILCSIGGLDRRAQPRLPARAGLASLMRHDRIVDRVLGTSPAIRNRQQIKLLLSCRDLEISFADFST